MQFHYNFNMNTYKLYWEMIVSSLNVIVWKIFSEINGISSGYYHKKPYLFGRLVQDCEGYGVM